MYRTRHIDRKILSLFVVCSSVLISASYSVNASNGSEKSPPLRVYIPNPSSFVNYFTTDQMQYNPDDFILSAKGNVEIQQGDVVLKADTVEYNQMENRVRALGNVVLLNSGGEVSFFDKLELKHAIKEGIINKFKAQMIDNDTFMAAEAKKPGEHIANYTASNKKKSFFDRMFTYLTPDFLTASNAEANAENLANLAPSAGDNPATLDKPVIGNVPLIVLSDDKTPATGEAKGDPANTDSTATTALAAPSPNPTAKAADEAKQAAVEVKDTPPVIPAITPLITPTKEAEDKKTEENKSIEDIVTKNVTGEDQKSPEEKDGKKPDAKPENKSDSKSAEKLTENTRAEKKPQAKKVADKKKAKVVTKKAAPAKNTKETAEKKLAKDEASSEPAETLSPESRELLSKIAPIVKPKKAKDNTPFKIEHSHDMQDLFKGNESGVTAQGDVLGAKVETRAQSANTDYELERAYNAVISGQSEAAIEIYKDILNNAPNNTDALFGLATLYHRARQLDKARALYGRLLAIDPNHRDGFNNFLVLLADEAPHEALNELEKLEEKNPGFSTIPAQMAVIYEKLGDSDKATEKMFRAVALAPENLTYRYNLAIMLDKQKNYDEAAKLYKQLIEASERGEKIPGNIDNIQQRLTFISSNRP